MIDMSRIFERVFPDSMNRINSYVKNVSEGKIPNPDDSEEKIIKDLLEEEGGEAPVRKPPRKRPAPKEEFGDFDDFKDDVKSDDGFDEPDFDNDSFEGDDFGEGDFEAGGDFPAEPEEAFDPIEDEPEEGLTLRSMGSGDKKYFGKRDDDFLYIVVGSEDDPDDTTARVVNQEGDEVMSLEDNEELGDDPMMVDVLRVVAAELEPEEIAYDLFAEYVLPALEQEVAAQEDDYTDDYDDYEDEGVVDGEGSDVVDTEDDYTDDYDEDTFEEDGEDDYTEDLPEPAPRRKPRRAAPEDTFETYRVKHKDKTHTVQLCEVKNGVYIRVDNRTHRLGRAVVDCYVNENKLDVRNLIKDSLDVLKR